MFRQPGAMRKPPFISRVTAMELFRRHDPTSTPTSELLRLCGKHEDIAFESVCASDDPSPYRFLIHQLNERRETALLGLWTLPLQRVVQASRTSCRCSPFGRIAIRGAAVSGSMADMFYYYTEAMASDDDVMIEFGPVHWTIGGTGDFNSAEGGPDRSDSLPPWAPHLIIAETENPGFVQVLQERLDDCPHEGRLCFEASSVRRLNKDIIASSAASSEDESNLESYPKGPAFTSVQAPEKIGVVAAPEIDYVPCLRVPGWWPTDEFFTRSYKHNWPPKVALDDIRRFGVHLVPCGAEGSRTYDSEWRLSYSRAEAVVSRYVYAIQRKTLVSFKTCNAAVQQEDVKLKSYLAKTALFWLCQETPMEDWTGVVKGILMLIRRLERAVLERSLPCFFDANTNLLALYTDHEIEAVSKTLTAISRDLSQLLFTVEKVVTVDGAEERD